MAVSTLEPEVATRFATVADLIEHFGEALARRMRLNPAPGTATVDDVIAIHDREKRLFELVDGILVEKSMGFYESRLAFVLGLFIAPFVRQHKLGLILGADGMLRLKPDQIRIPDLSFIAMAQFPDRKLPTEQVPFLHADLALEVLSPSNTKAEMAQEVGRLLPVRRRPGLVHGPGRAIRPRLHHAGSVRGRRRVRHARRRRRPAGVSTIGMRMDRRGRVAGLRRPDRGVSEMAKTEGSRYDRRIDGATTLVVRRVGLLIEGFERCG